EESTMLGLSSLPEPLLMAAGIDLDKLDTVSSATPEMNQEMASLNGPVPGGMPPPAAAEASTSSGGSDEMVTIGGDQLDFNKHKEAFEKEFIIKALTTFKGRINQTALHANIPKKTLLRKIEKYGINAKDYADA
ncbi:MAG: helix-turn-helix domain-containing protein, partial [Pseudomonadota bacterium]